jgi:hypothetical protein
MPMNPRLLRPIANNIDRDAAVYLNAVAQADGQQLEPAVRKAINDFVVGLKRDNLWSALKASCILAGARTLSGALTPLKGTAPTNNGPFVSGDYARGGATPGLLGNGTSKTLTSNRANNADPQDNVHHSVYVTANTTASRNLIGTGISVAGTTRFQPNVTGITAAVRLNGSVATFTGSAAVPGFIGSTRDNSATFLVRFAGSNQTGTQTSGAPNATSVVVFSSAGAASPSDARLAFYSIGESLDLALLDSRVSALITAIGAAIP